MKQSTAFAYTQARLQARHGDLLDESAWRQMEAQQSLANYLNVARQTAVRPWILGLQSGDNIHTVEQILLLQFLHYVELVASWQPRDWREATKWVALLPDLPVLQHLLTVQRLPDWVLRQTRLKSFATADRERRVQLLLDSAYRPLVLAWQQGLRLPDGWFQHWQSLLPPNWGDRQVDRLMQVAELLRGHALSFSQLRVDQTRVAREQLAARLRVLFRQNAQQPAAAFVHLALVALELERLRSGINRRMLFPELRVAS